MQEPGPFTRWTHLHKFEPRANDTCTMTDRIEYVPPLGPVGAFATSLLVKRRIKRLLAYRHELLRADLDASPTSPTTPRCGWP